MQGGKAPHVVTIEPLAFLAKRLVPDGPPVRVLVGPGRSPDTYEPSPQQLTEVARARRIFALGFAFERTLAKKLAASGQGPQVVDLQKGLALRREEEGEHAGQADPHVWLDPRNMAKMAKTMAMALDALDPGPDPGLDRRLAELLRELAHLDEEIGRLLAPLKGQRLYVFHDAFGYFCERYGLSQVALAQGGKEPGGSGLKRFIEQARADRARAIYVQPQFSRRAAETVATELGAAVVWLDPLDRRYPDMLRRMAHAIVAHSAPRD